MDKAEKKSTSQSGENEIKIKPEKVQNLEADEYLIEKALKAQENAWERMRREHWMRMAQERATKLNKIRRKRKTERQNRRGGRK